MVIIVCGLKNDLGALFDVLLYEYFILINENKNVSVSGIIRSVKQNKLSIIHYTTESEQ